MNSRRRENRVRFDRAAFNRGVHAIFRLPPMNPRRSLTNLSVTVIMFGMVVMAALGAAKVLAGLLGLL